MKMTYREWLEKMLTEKYVGKEITYEGKKYKVVGVDYNGNLLIDKKAEFTDTTAITESQAKRGD